MGCPSTPAAPLLAFTCLYASHTSRLAIQNGFALSMAVIPLRVATGIAPNDDAPSVRFHYRTINPTTAPPPLCPASVLGPWRRLTAWVSPFASGRQVPVFLTEACLEVTPPSCRTPVGQSAGVPQPLLAG